MTLQTQKQQLKIELQTHFDPIELGSILSILIVSITGWNQLQQILNKDTELSPFQENQFIQAMIALKKGMPIQYITGKAWFMGNEYLVNEKVLIPRPETEELIEWITNYAKIIDKPLHILDIGTGSGCICIALKLALPNCILTGLDCSDEALGIAKQNAILLNTDIHWIQDDILNTAYLPNQYDLIVSNPPYIPYQEASNMAIQIKKFEPSIALFVPNEDPLLFYRAIARLAKQYLSINGQLFFEIHYDQGKALLALFEEMGYHAELRQDMFGNDRMLRASLK